jgi:hypothetical protein
MAMNWFVQLFSGSSRRPLSQNDIEGYCGFTFERTNSVRADAKERFEKAISEIKRNYPGRILESEEITTRIASDMASVRLCFYFRKGEVPTKFSGIMTRIFEKHWY